MQDHEQAPGVPSIGTGAGLRKRGDSSTVFRHITTRVFDNKKGRLTKGSKHNTILQRVHITRTPPRSRPPPRCHTP